MKQDYIVKKWFAWYPVNIAPADKMPKIVWLIDVARWWHPQVGFFGSWICADLRRWGYLEGKRL